MDDYNLSKAGEITEMKCVICDRDMIIKARSSSYDYLFCRRCHWNVTQNRTNSSIECIYNDTPTFDAIGDREDNVSNAINSLKDYFKWTGFLSEGKKFLDVGCSEGVWVEAASHLGMDAHGIEIDEPKFQRNLVRGINVHRYSEDIGKFDFVLNRHVIEHVENPVEFIRLLTSYLKSGGVLYVETPNNDSLECRLIGWRIREDRFVKHLYPPTHLNGLTTRAVRKMKGVISECGCELVGVYTYSDSYQLDYDTLPLNKKFWCKSGLGVNLVFCIRKY